MEDSRGLVAGSSDPAFLLSTEGRILAWNEGAEKLLEYEAREAAGQPCWRILYGVTSGGEPVCTPGCAAAACFQRGQPFSAPDLHVRRKDGQSVPVSLSTLLLSRVPKGQSPAEASALVFLRPITGPQAPASADLLKLHTLGPFRIAFGTQAVDWSVWKRKQSVTLLAFLAHHRGQPVHRERIIDALWPEAPLDAALERLKVVSYGLRRQLGAIPGAAVVRHGTFYSLDRNRTWLDVAVFENLMERGLAQAARRETNKALASLEAARILYRGDYLEEEAYSEWTQLERARLKESYLELLRVMGTLHERQGSYREAAQLYRLALTQEPGREEIHRLLIRALIHLGARTEAAQQLQRCIEILQTELDMPPSPETLALRESLLGGG